MLALVWVLGSPRGCWGSCWVPWGSQREEGSRLQGVLARQGPSSIVWKAGSLQMQLVERGQERSREELWGEQGA